MINMGMIDKFYCVDSQCKLLDEINFIRLFEKLCIGFRFGFFFQKRHGLYQ